MNTKQNKQQKALYIQLDHDTYANIMLIQMEMYKKTKNKPSTKETISACINMISNRMSKGEKDIIDKLIKIE